MTTANCLTAAFLFLEESLHTKKGKRRDSTLSYEEGSVNSDTNTFETNGSLQSNDSGIELLSSEKLSKDDSDTELIDLTRSEIDDDDELVMVESDVDTDSDFERVNSDTELLVKEPRNSDSRHTRSNSTISRSCIPECLVTQCGPRQCYTTVRNSLMDSYHCVVVCLECLKGCDSCCHRSWTPGEPGSQAMGKLTRLGHPILNLLRLIVDRRVFLSTLLYGLLAFIVVMCNEVSILFQMCTSMYMYMYLSLIHI